MTGISVGQDVEHRADSSGTCDGPASYAPSYSDLTPREDFCLYEAGQKYSITIKIHPQRAATPSHAPSTARYWAGEAGPELGSPAKLTVQA